MAFICAISRFVRAQRTWRPEGDGSMFAPLAPLNEPPLFSRTVVARTSIRIASPQPSRCVVRIERRARGAGCRRRPGSRAGARLGVFGRPGRCCCAGLWGGSVGVWCGSAVRRACHSGRGAGRDDGPQRPLRPKARWQLRGNFAHDVLQLLVVGPGFLPLLFALPPIDQALGQTCPQRRTRSPWSYSKPGGRY